MFSPVLLTKVQSPTPPLYHLHRQRGPWGTTEAPVTAPLFTDIRFMFSEPPAGEASVCRTPFTAEAAKADKVIRLTANRATFGPWQAWLQSGPSPPH